MPQHRATAEASRPGAVGAPRRRARRAHRSARGRAAPPLRCSSPAHQFPTGVVLHPDRRAAAIAWAAASGGVIVEDDYDGELRYDRQPVGALQALAPAARRLRRHRQQDARAGPAARLAGRATARCSTPISSLRAAEDVHVPAPDQIALCQLLRSGAYERHVRRMRARYRARRDRLVAMLAERAPALVARRDLGRARGAAGAPRRGPDLRPSSSPRRRAARSSCYPLGAALPLPGARRATAS